MSMSLPEKMNILPLQCFQIEKKEWKKIYLYRYDHEAMYITAEEAQNIIKNVAFHTKKEMMNISLEHFDGKKTGLNYQNNKVLSSRLN